MTKNKNGPYKVWALITSVLLLVVFLVGASPSLAGTNTAVPLGYSVTAPENVFISFEIPKGWHKADKVKIAITATYSTTEIAKIEAKSTQNGSWSNITDTCYLDVSENATVYIQVTDKQGVVTARSQYIECFDREAPEVRASRSGQLLRIEATDRQSGVDCVYLDGERYSDLSNGTVEIKLDKQNTDEEKLFIQAVDHAGNLSATYSMKNPYYKDSTSFQGTQSSGQTAQTTSSSQPISNTTTSAASTPPASTTSTQPPSTANTTSSKPEANASGTATYSEAENKGAPGVVQVGDKQFITIETKDEKIFYLIIDGEGSVYLVTEATTTDLQSFTRDEAETDGSSSPVSDSNGAIDPNADTDTLIDGGSLPGSSEVDLMDESSPDGANGKDSTVSGSENTDKTNNDNGDSADSNDTDEDAVKKGNPIPGWVIIALMVFILSVVAYLFFVVLPRKKAKEAYIEDYDEDEDVMPETYPHKQEEMEDEKVEEQKPEAPQESDAAESETNSDYESELH